jgi:glucan-binding YG repeat protein
MVALLAICFLCGLSHAKAENTGWVKIDGYWYYYSSQNTYYTNGAYHIDGNRYYFDSFGIMQANKWVSDYGTWMYAGPGGELVTGWKKINNKWYWFDSWGELCPQDGGTYKIDGKTYLFDQNGALIQFRSGWYELTLTKSSGAKEIYGFTLNAEGVVCAGWASYTYVYSSGGSYTEWYCLNSSGDRVNGWQKINGKWYYFDLWDSTLCFQSDAAVGCSIHAVDGELYYFNMGGGLVQGESGWRKIRQSTNYGSYCDRWCYLQKSGTVMTGWHEVDGRTYYFEEETGLLYPDENSNREWQDYIPSSVNDRVYIFRKDSSLLTGKAGWVECMSREQVGCDYYQTVYFGCTIDNNGAVQPGWIRIRTSVMGDSDEGYMYLESSYEPATGWKLIKGKKYYFDEDGIMVCNRAEKINGTYFLFDCDGVLVEGKTGFYKAAVKKWDAWEGIKTSYEWYYFSDKGELLTGWQKDNGKWYWFDNVTESYYKERYGRMTGLNGGLCETDDGVYYFEKGGALVQGKKGWQKLADGSWFYLNSDGSVCTGITEIDGKAYYFYSSGILHTAGTATIGGSLYVFGPGGELINTPGWNKVGTDSNGNPRYYYINSDGTATTGWMTLNGKQYYFDTYSGAMYINTARKFYSSGSNYSYSVIYLFDASGARVTGKKGWYKLNSGYQGSANWYFFSEYGEVLTGYQLIGGKGYYFDDYDGEMYKDSVVSVNGELMLFGKDGARVTKTGWYNDFYYINENGLVQTGWKKISGKWYYFYEDDTEFYNPGGLAFYAGVLSVYEDGEYVEYFLEKGGALASAGWHKLDEEWYYVDAGGHPSIGWEKIDGTWYYFGSNHKMYHDGVYMIDRRPEYFNHSGACETAVSGSNWKRVGGTLRYMVNGKYVTGWQKIGTKEYYFESNGDLRLD